MTEFYVPKTGEIRMASGIKHVVVKGIRNVPDDLADSIEATRYGIKPTHEMTDAECDDLGVPRVPVTDVQEPKRAPVVQPKIDTGTAAEAKA